MRIGQFIIQEDSAVYLVPTGLYILVTAVFIAVLKNRKTELRLCRLTVQRSRTGFSCTS